MKYQKILNDTWEYLENNFKASEISFSVWLYLIIRKCDNDYCLKKCIKLLWEQWVWYDNEERNWYKSWLKMSFNVKVV